MKRKVAIWKELHSRTCCTILLSRIVSNAETERDDECDGVVIDVGCDAGKKRSIGLKFQIFDEGKWSVPLAAGRPVGEIEIVVLPTPS